jgi:hypothetical protein
MARARKGRRGAKKKDPNKPKRGLSSFMYFSQDKRKEVLARDPTLKIGDVAKAIGLLWKSVTPAEKSMYEGKAAQDKVRYLAEMEGYTPPDFSSDDDSDDGKRRKKKKVKKDPNKPKKNLSAYMFFCADQRAANKTVTMQELGAAWKAIGNKDKYVALAEQDKIRYKNAMEHYVPPGAAVVEEEEEEEEESEEDDSEEEESESE